MMARPRLANPTASGQSHYFRAATHNAELARGISSDYDVMFDESTQTVTTRDGTGRFLWPWNTERVGGARHAAVGTTVTITNTGTSGGADFRASLADFAAGSGDWEIKLPSSITLDLAHYDTLSCCIVPDASPSRRLFVTGQGSLPTADTMPATSAVGACSVILGPSGATIIWALISIPSPSSAKITWTGVKVAPQDRINYGGIVAIYSAGGTTLADYPSGQVFDRCWLSGDGSGDAVPVGFKCNGWANAVMDTWITGCADILAGSNESKAMIGYDATRHNYFRRVMFEASGEGFMFGGADPSNGNSGLLDPADNFFYDCAFTKKLAWMTAGGGGGPIAMKNNFEMKNARRITMLNVVCFRMHCSSQSDHIVLNNTVNGSANNSSNCLEDIVIHNLVGRDGYSAISANARTDGGAGIPTTQAKRICITNARFENLGKNWPGSASDEEGCILRGGGAFQGFLLDQFTWTSDATATSVFTGDFKIFGEPIATDGQASNVVLTNMAGAIKRIRYTTAGPASNGVPVIAAWASSYTWAGNAWYGTITDGGTYTPGLTNYADAATMGFNTTTGAVGSPASGVGYGGVSPGCVKARLDTMNSAMSWAYSR